VVEISAAAVVEIDPANTIGDPHIPGAAMAVEAQQSDLSRLTHATYKVLHELADPVAHITDEGRVAAGATEIFAFNIENIRVSDVNGIEDAEAGPSSQAWPRILANDVVRYQTIRPLEVLDCLLGLRPVIAVFIQLCSRDSAVQQNL
jgi:hypothetical protein